MNTLINIQILKENISGDFKVNNNDINNDFKNYLYIEAKSDFLYIKQNQINFQIEFKIPANIKENGFFIIKTDVFNTLINTSSGEELLIKVENDVIYFETKTNKTEIKTIKKEKYPELYIDFNKKNSLKIKKSLLIEGINSVYSSASQGVINPQLSSVFVVIKNKIIEFFSTNTFIVSEYKNKIDIEKDINFILPVKNATIISDILLKNKQDYIYINKENKNIIFYNEFIKIYSSTIETDFLNYKEYFKPKNNTEIIINKKEIIDYFIKARFFSTESNKVNMEIKNQKLLLSITNKEIGTTKEEIFVTCDNRESIVFPSYNYIFLLKCIKILKAEEIIFSFNETTKTLIIKDKENIIKSIVAPQNN